MQAGAVEATGECELYLIGTLARQGELSFRKSLVRQSLPVPRSLLGAISHLTPWHDGVESEAASFFHAGLPVTLS
jgi:hypothetical protein